MIIEESVTVQLKLDFDQMLQLHRLTIEWLIKPMMDSMLFFQNYRLLLVQSTQMAHWIYLLYQHASYF